MVDIERSFEGIGDNLYDGLYLVDLQRKITYWNKAAERITGFNKQEVLGRYCGDNILNSVDSKGCGLCMNGCILAETIRDGETRVREVFLYHKGGYRVPAFIRAMPLKSIEGGTIGGIGLFSEVNSREALYQKIAELEKLALVDLLTGLSNRRHLTSVLEAQFSMRQRAGVPLGILLFDVDGFKNFNDTYGHEAGDRVLQVTASTLGSSVRASDTIGRWGGEEFLGVFSNADEDSLWKVGKKLCMLVRNSKIEILEKKLAVTVSVGGAVALDNDTPESLLKRADDMLYHSKKSGRDRVTLRVE